MGEAWHEGISEAGFNRKRLGPGFPVLEDIGILPEFAGPGLKRSNHMNCGEG